MKRDRRPSKGIGVFTGYGRNFRGYFYEGDPEGDKGKVREDLVEGSSERKGPVLGSLSLDQFTSSLYVILCRLQVNYQK